VRAKGRTAVGVWVAIWVVATLAPASARAFPSHLPRRAPSIVPHRGTYLDRYMIAGPWKDGGFTWRMEAFDEQGFATGINLVARQTATSGKHPVEQLSWQFVDGLAAGDLQWAPDLSTASIQTGTDMGTYGAIDLALDTPSSATTETLTCRTNGKIWGKLTQRIGTLTGSFDFTPGAPGLPATISLTSVPVEVDKVLANGYACPPPRAPRCRVGTYFDATRQYSGDALSIHAARSGTTASLYLDRGGYDVANQVGLDALVEGKVPPSTVVVKKRGVTIDASGLGAFADGVLRLTTKRSYTGSAGHCRYLTVEQRRTSGTITVHFATGDTPYTGILDAKGVIVYRV
jgi:hypothetical protein